MQFFFQRYIRLHRSIIGKLNDILGEHELSFSLWEVLHYLNKHGSSTLVDISEYYRVEKPSITRRANRLIERGLVEVVQSRDKREKVIHLTDLGEAVFKVCRRKITELEHEVMKGIPDHEKNILFQILPKIQKNILNEEGERE